MQWQTDYNTSNTTASQHSEKENGLSSHPKSRLGGEPEAEDTLPYTFNGITPFWGTILCLLSSIIAWIRRVCEVDLKI